MSYTKQVDLLNDLIAKCYDSEKGYKEAAENVDVSNIHLRDMFTKYAQQRYDFGHNLKAIIRDMGGHVEKGDTLTSKVHRLWMDVKKVFSTTDEKAMLEEVIFGEKNALKNYDEVLEDLVSGSKAHEEVSNQRGKINQALRESEQLLKAYLPS